MEKKFKKIKVSEYVRRESQEATSIWIRDKCLNNKAKNRTPLWETYAVLLAVDHLLTCQNSGENRKYTVAVNRNISIILSFNI